MSEKKVLIITAVLMILAGISMLANAFFDYSVFYVIAVTLYFIVAITNVIRIIEARKKEG